MESQKKKVIIVVSVASMIRQFMIPNIKMLVEMGYKVEVACNFLDGSTCTLENVLELRKTLTQMKVDCFQIDFSRDVYNLRKVIKAYRELLDVMRGKRLPLYESGSKTESIEYAFMHCATPIGGVVGRLAAHKQGIKVIYMAHGFHFFKGAPIKNWLIFYPIESFFSKWTDILITINFEDHLLARKNLKSKEVKYVPGVGIDVGRINEIKIDKKAIRSQIGIEQHVFLLMSVGELNRNKNHETVIRALGKLQLANVYYIICGIGSKRKELEDLCKELRISNKVKFMGFRDDVISICKAADVFVLPSYREGLSVALMEAMASGLPVICSKIRGNVDLIGENEGGLLCLPDKTDEYAKAIQWLIEHREERKKMGMRNKEFIKKFDLDVINSMMRQVYTQLAD